MPTYRVGNEPLKTRQSMRRVLCEHCGKSMGTALFSRDYQGITAEEAIELWPYLRVDFDMHETQCPVFLESPKVGSPPADELNNSAKKERRSWDRVPVQVFVFCQNVQGEDELCWSARVIDISREGMKLLSPHKFEPTTIIRIGKADGGEESSRLLQALVVWAHGSPREKWTLGCALTKELSEAELLSWIDKTADSQGHDQSSMRDRSNVRSRDTEKSLRGAEADFGGANGGL